MSVRQNTHQVGSGLETRTIGSWDRTISDPDRQLRSRQLALIPDDGEVEKTDAVRNDAFNEHGCRRG